MSILTQQIATGQPKEWFSSQQRKRNRNYFFYFSIGESKKTGNEFLFQLLLGIGNLLGQSRLPKKSQPTLDANTRKRTRGQSTVTTNVVISTKDTNVLIIAMYGFVRLATQVCHTSWFMKTDSLKYVNIKKISRFLGVELCCKIYTIHDIAGFYITSYFYKVGKPEYWSHLDAKKVWIMMWIQFVIFLQQACYDGKANEDYGSTQVRLYDNQKKNMTTQTSPPDAIHARQHLKGVNLVVYIWRRCLEWWLERKLMKDGC